MGLRMAYLVSRYPAISHTFILREVLELRKLGFEIDVASINGVDRPILALTAEEREEANHAWYVKQRGFWGALSANLHTALRRPLPWCRGAWFAIRMGRTDVKRILLCSFYFIEAVMVGRWMEKKDLRHLHVHFATPASTVGLMLTRIFPFTLSITVHGPDEFYDVPGYYLPEKIAASRFLCAIGMFARSQLMKISSPSEWKKIEVTPLGVDPTVFSPCTFHRDFDFFEVICVGRLVPAKGQHVLLKAIANLVAQGRRVRLRIVGDGPDRSSLQELAHSLGIESAVVFEGSVNQDRIRHLYAAAHVFTLPSFAEGIPVVLMEAMAMEIPCVTTWITGIPELIRDGIDGILVPPSDDRALAAAIAQLMDHPELRRRIGEGGRARVIEKYHLRDNVAHLAGVLRKHLREAA
jgi:colanic acid/amylovoran biosynthesis glycosyltransferase